MQVYRLRCNPLPTHCIRMLVPFMLDGVVAEAARCGLAAVRLDEALLESLGRAESCEALVGFGDDF